MQLCTITFNNSMMVNCDHYEYYHVRLDKSDLVFYSREDGSLYVEDNGHISEFHIIFCCPIVWLSFRQQNILRKSCINIWIINHCKVLLSRFLMIGSYLFVLWKSVIELELKTNCSLFNNQNIELDLINMLSQLTIKINGSIRIFLK